MAELPKMITVPSLDQLKKHALGEVDAFKNGSHAYDAAKCEGLLRKTKLDPLIDMPVPPVCISIEVNGKTAIWGTLGNISVLKGRAKSKKTTAASPFIGAAIRNGDVAGTIKCSFPEDKTRIVQFDAEESDYHAWKSVMRSFAIAGGRKEDAVKKFDVFCMRALTPEDRIDAIYHYLSKNKEVGFMVLDGVRDIIHDINDPAQANKAVQHLMTWTKDYNIHILTIIHQNKSLSDSNARGHVGTEITNKAETVAEVVKDSLKKDISWIQPSECRNMEFEKFAFAYDDYGVPRILEGQKDLSTAKDSKNKNYADIPTGIHLDVLDKVFSVDKALSYNELWRSLKVNFGIMGLQIWDNAAKDFVTQYKQAGLINAEPGKRNQTFYIRIRGIDEMPF